MKDNKWYKLLEILCYHIMAFDDALAVAIFHEGNTTQKQADDLTKLRISLGDTRSLLHNINKE